MAWYSTAPYTTVQVAGSGPLRTARTAARAADRSDHFGRSHLATSLYTVHSDSTCKAHGAQWAMAGLGLFNQKSAQALAPRDLLRLAYFLLLYSSTQKGPGHRGRVQGDFFDRCGMSNVGQGLVNKKIYGALIGLLIKPNPFSNLVVYHLVSP